MGKTFVHPLKFYIFIQKKYTFFCSYGGEDMKAGHASNMIDQKKKLFFKLK